MFRTHLSLACLLCLSTAALRAAEPTEQDLEFFERAVRPLFAEHCFECHGPEQQKSELRLDHISTILAGGERGPALTPGSPADSRMIEAIEYLNVDLQMPPKYMLGDAEIDTLIEWVRRGAPWPDEPPPGAAPEEPEFDLLARKASHWAWQPVQRAKPPAVRAKQWPRNDVDRFILARLEAEGLRPAPEADRRTLIRRLTFALTGLPPTRAEIEAFLQDDSDEAYESLVDRLLESPRFGERWARHWFDLVRYAETYGHEQDYPIRFAWRYRDYVIRALNAGVPYDQFVREHIAGDLIEDPRQHPEEGYNESILGTGFWFLHQATHAPVDVRQDEADRIDNQIDVMSKAFLGMTVACARCHDHKFDAISTKDYYALAGFLQSSRQEYAFLDPKDTLKSARKDLVKLQAEIDAALAGSIEALEQGSAGEIAEYLIAAHDVQFGTPTPEESHFLKPDILFEDFEEGTYTRWSVEGEAFGDVPARGTHRDQQRVEGFRGEFLVNSFTGGDKPTGKLMSRPFVIERRYVSFLVGGGDHANEAAVNLIVAGDVVRTATGRNRESLEPAHWDVSEYMGRTGHIEILDAAEGGWGHINADQFVFSEHTFPDSVSRDYNVVAREHGVDADRLARWVTELQTASRDDDSPLSAWLRVATTHRDDAGETFDRLRGAVSSRLTNAAQETDEDLAETVLFEDFSGENTNHWFASGFAFTANASRSGESRIENDGVGFVPPDTAHSGLISDKLQGVLRSPDFEITHDSIHYRMAGTGGQIRLVVEGYQLRPFNGLLFDSTLFDVQTDGEWVWHHETGDLYKWKGRTAYIEIIDDGDGWVAVDEIRFADGRPAGDPPSSVARLVLESQPGNVTALSQAYEDLAIVALEHFRDGSASADEIAYLEWLRARDLVGIDAGDGEVGRLAVRKREIEGGMGEPLRVLAMTEGTPKDEHVFIRGSHKNLGKLAPRQFLTATHGPDQPPVEDGSGRLALADRIFDGHNPLTARVFVNRVWHQLFGRGIVPSVDNFGMLGQPPSHPELLDYLATWTRKNGWSLKDLIRLLVTTSTYRMSSAPLDGEAEEADPANELLHRMNITRLEGEAIRDSILYVSGQLDETMYGPSIPIYISKFMEANRRPPESGPMDGDRRRTIYVEVRRNFLSPMLLAFDTPVPDTTIGARTESNIPAQALILMNDPFVVEMARAWADDLLANGPDSVEARMRLLYERALGRQPSTEELARVEWFLADQARTRGIAADAIPDDVELWADVCHVMFTLKEFIFVA